jgi:hypothetical protein
VIDLREDIMRSQDDQLYVPAYASSAKKPYSKPVLTEHCDVRDITLAPSPGTFESGYGAGFKSPGERSRRGRSEEHRDPRDNR